MIRAFRRANATRGVRMSLATALFLFAAAATGVQAQVQDPPPERLAIFLDCGFCDQNFLRQEMGYVDWVRDREVADVHLLVTRQSTGAGGSAATIDAIGVGAFQGVNHTAVHTTAAGATDSETRDGMLRALQAVLVPYLLRTPLSERIRVEIDDLDAGDAAVAEGTPDPWRNWTFEIYADGSADFESRQRSVSTRYGVYVNRVTEEWKIQLRPFFNYSEDRFERGDDEIRSISRRNGFTSYVVRSISPHWSVGAFGDVFTSTFDNVDMRYRLMPAIEWSLYPYRDATRRQLTVAYRLGASHTAYRDTTIYGKVDEVLVQHALNAGYRLRQPWGEVDMGVSGSQYLHDLGRFSVQLDGEIEFRVTQGLSIEVGASMAFIHDQLNLPKGDADLEEVLLRRRRLETDYEAGLSFGFRYRFGSIFNNVVNPRLGGLGSQDRF